MENQKPETLPQFIREEQIGCFGLALDLLNGESFDLSEGEEKPKAPQGTLQNHTSELLQ